MRSWFLAVAFVSLPAWAQPVLDGCPVFPEDNVWNVPVDTLPVDAHSAAYVGSIGAAGTVHPDFGSGLYEGAPIGIPFVTVPGSQARVRINFTAYGDESDAGPYPVPASAPVEGGNASDGDRHVLVVDKGACRLYELYRAFKQADGSWNADQGSIYELHSNDLRPDGWTSADAAGLPILPGLARYAEVAAGEIRHALRFTAPTTRKAYVWPARHYASSQTSASLPPMGQRFRLRSGAVDPATFSTQARVIVKALMKYGMILADNGSAWYLSGAPDPGWNNDQLVSELKRLKGSFFEAVDESSLRVDPNSGEAGTPNPTPTPTPTPTPMPTPTPTPTPSPSPTPSPKPATLHLTSPNGGEVWRIGTSDPIVWTASGFTGNVRIDISRTGGTTWQVLVSSTPNDGRQVFTMAGPATNRARVRVSSLSQPAVKDVSDTLFQIR